MDLSQYLEMFIDETKEHLQNLNDQVLILEAEPDNIDTINEIFRAAHSLKGMAGTMGFKRMQRLTHDMENVFSKIREGKMGVTPDLVDVVFKCLDAIEEYLDCIINTSDEGENDNEDIIKMLNACLEGESLADVAASEASSDDESAPAAASEASVEDGGNQTADVSDDKRKYLHIDIADFEKNAITEARAKNLNVYGATVYIDENCILKAARAFLVFKGIEAIGEVIKSVPGVQDIEDEKFDFDFSMLIISEKSLDEVKKIISDVSEIKEVIIDNYDIPSDVEVVSSVQEAEQKEDKKDDKKKATAAAAAKANAKPVAGRSVRVDIEKLDVLMNLVSELIIAKNGLVSVSNNQTDGTES